MTAVVPASEESSAITASEARAGFAVGDARPGGAGVLGALSAGASLLFGVVIVSTGGGGSLSGVARV